VAGLSNRFRVEYRLDASRMTLLAESPLGIIPPLRKHRRPDSIRCISSPPVFGREMLSMISRSKIVLNGAIDMAGEDRGNMRCYEAMGCGALLVSDQGRYPKGMINNDTMLTYDTPSSAVGVIGHALDNWTQHSQIARGGHIMLKNDYGKDRQWSDFLRLISIL